MIIAIDYDGTITADSAMFLDIIKLMKLFNHEPIIVTMRHACEADERLNKLDKYAKVYYTGRKAKRNFMADLHIYPSIWIDDNPHWVDTDSK